jgi:serine protease Do
MTDQSESPQDPMRQWRPPQADPGTQGAAPTPPLPTGPATHVPAEPVPPSPASPATPTAIWSAMGTTTPASAWAPPATAAPATSAPATSAPAAAPDAAPAWPTAPYLSAGYVTEPTPAGPNGPTGPTGGAPVPGHGGQPRPKRTVTPALLLAAVVGTAVLTSGGTFLAVSAAGSHTIDASKTGATTVAVTPPPSTPATQAPATGSTSIVDIVKAVSPAVVTIQADGVTATDPTTGQVGQGTAIGSGVIFDANGLILTNHHVVSGNPSKLTVTLKDGRSLPATIYGIDTMTDLAIVKVDATGLPTARIGDSASIQVGQEAIAIGSPLGEFTDSVTSGIVSAVGRSIDVEGGHLSNLIQTDTAINPGNSGGPLLDAAGNVIGINTAVAGNSQGIGFAIPIDIAKPMLAQASAGQPLARAWLGVRFETITPAIQQQANLPVANGAWIPTAAALQSDGSGSNGQQAPNGQLPNGQDPFGGQSPFNGQDPFGGLFGGQDPFGQGGQGQPGQVPNGQNGQGQTVTPTQSAIVPGSPAAQAGLAEGDIITAVDGTQLDATHTLDLLVGGMKPGQKVTLTVLRNGQSNSVAITLGTRPQSA